MTIKEWLKLAKTKIAALDAELIALEAFGPRVAEAAKTVAGGADETRGLYAGQADRSWLVAHGEEEVAAAEIAVAEEMVRRRALGEPLAYILGEKEFYGRRFKVSPDVLIPRPETEALIALVKQIEIPPHARMIEVGTGSGCVAITLALEFPQAEIVATDAYLKALDIATENDLYLEGRVHFLHSNLLRDLTFPEEMREFEVLVANLPYVDPSWDWVKAENLAFEPKTALFATRDHGLSFYKRLLTELQKSEMVRARNLIFEADPCQHEELAALAAEKGYDLRKIEGFGLWFEKHKG